MPKILLVEDDKELIGLLRNFFESEHYSVDAACDGLDGAEYLKQADYDLIVLDWDLPGQPGVEICRSYRAGGGRAPILMLTGRAEIESKMFGLDSGADDYLTKPFDMRELAARLRALLRRPVVAASPTLRVGGLELDPVKHIVTRNGSEVRLSKKDFELLELLMRHPGRFFTTECLLERVWSFDSEATGEAVRTAVKRLRKILDDKDDENASLIETVRKVGYRLKDGE